MALTQKILARDIIFSLIIIPTSFYVNKLYSSNITNQKNENFFFTNTKEEPCKIDVNFYAGWITWIYFYTNVFCVIKLLFSIYVFLIWDKKTEDDETNLNNIKSLINYLISLIGFFPLVLFYKSNVIYGEFKVCTQPELNNLFWMSVIGFGWIHLHFIYLLFYTSFLLIFLFIKDLMIAAEFKMYLPKRKPNKIISKSKCIVCIDESVEILLRPCNHICFCEDCFKSFQSNLEVKSCPICRSCVKKSEKIFYS